MASMRGKKTTLSEGTTKKSANLYLDDEKKGEKVLYI